MADTNKPPEGKLEVALAEVRRLIAEYNACDGDEFDREAAGGCAVEAMEAYLALLDARRCGLCRWWRVVLKGGFAQRCAYLDTFMHATACCSHFEEPLPGESTEKPHES